MAVLATLLVVGCGGPSNTSRVRASIHTYLAALADRDWQAACGELTPNARRQLFALAVEGAPKKTLATIGGTGTSDVECDAILRLAFEDVPATQSQRLRFVSVAQLSFDDGRAYARLVGVDLPTLTRVGSVQVPVLVNRRGAWVIDSLGVDLPGGASATIARARRLVRIQAAQRRSAAALARVHQVATDLGQLYDLLVSSGKSREAAARQVNADVLRELARTRDARARFSLAQGTLSWERGILGQRSPVCARFKATLLALVPGVS